MGDRQKLRFIVLLFLLAWALPLAVAANETVPRVSRFDPLDLGGSLARYEMVEVSYLLRSPQGDLVRISRAWPSSHRTSWSVGYDTTVRGPRTQQVFWGAQRLDRWLSRGQQYYTQVIDYARETWTLIARVLSFLGVVVLFVSTWVIWFLLRPAMLGLSDRQVFLLAFAFLSMIWLYLTGIYSSVVYAVGLMLVPALLVTLLSLLLRRIKRLRPGQG